VTPEQIYRVAQAGIEISRSYQLHLATQDGVRVEVGAYLGSTGDWHYFQMNDRRLVLRLHDAELMGLIPTEEN
jgi:hypothetical protein